MTDLQGQLERVCRRHFGDDASVDSVSRLSAGASSQSWLITVRAASLEGPQKMVLQTSAGGEHYPLALDKQTQALVQRAAFVQGVPTPEVLFILDAEDSLGEGFASRWHAGETLGRRIVTDPQYATARSCLIAQCAEALASIHRAELAALPPLPQRSASAGLRELTLSYRRYGNGVPIFELALRWLEDHLPEDCPPALVHGDFRVGNFLVDETGLRQVLDWEMAHLGDPLEDLGWMMVNAWRFGVIDRPVGGIGQLDEWCREYSRASGIRADENVVRYWQMFGTVQWGVMCLWFAKQFIDGSVREIERLAIGRRVSEVQLDLMDLIRGRE